MSALTAAAFGTMALGSAGSAYTGAQAARAQGEYGRSVADANARMAEVRAGDALKRGNSAALRKAGDVQRTAGAQRAKLAAQGIDINYGTAADLQEETQRIGEADEKNIRINAWREAYGLKTEALNMSSQGKFNSLASENQARNTILTGGMQSLGYGLEGSRQIKKEREGRS